MTPNVEISKLSSGLISIIDKPEVYSSSFILE